MKYFVAFCFIVLTPPLAAEDIRGYGKTTWGMTVEKVAAAVPEATKVDPPGKYQDGLLSLLSSTVEISGDPYKVSYIFKDGKLSMVTLYIKWAKATFCHDNDYTAVARKLSEKYGPPVFEHLKREEREASWKAGSTTINLDYMAINGINVGLGCTSFVLVGYTPTVTSTSENGL